MQTKGRPLMNPFDLTGKVAIVTGGNGGIGLGMAGGLAAAGAKVVLSGRNQAKGDKAAAGLGHGAIFIAADVTKKAECEKLVAETVARCGRLDILVNNAGIAIRKFPHQYEEAEWHRVMDTNMTSAFLMSQAAYPHMVEAGGGKVINLGSVMGLAPLGAGPYSYSASKAAVHHITKILAGELADRHITVNAFAPGPFPSRMMAFATQAEEARRRTAATVPLGRIGRPDDIAGALLFLCGRGGSFVTGAILPIDGGISVQTGHRLFGEDAS